jgi:hypothetical protein
MVVGAGMAQTHPLWGWAQQLHPHVPCSRGSLQREVYAGHMAVHRLRFCTKSLSSGRCYCFPRHPHTHLAEPWMGCSLCWSPTGHGSSAQNLHEEDWTLSSSVSQDLPRAEGGARFLSTHLDSTESELSDTCSYIIDTNQRFAKS